MTERGRAGRVHAAALRALHVPGDPLVLPNAWDPVSAKLVVDAGFPVVATSSAAVARSLGSDDHEHMAADVALDAVRRIAGAVDVPVTADFEAGYGLEPAVIVERLLGAGASGCNIEDSDHRDPGALVDPASHAERLAAMRQAAGDGLVINARVDSFLCRLPDARDNAIERGRRYLDAGADCVYPIVALDDADIAAMVDALGTVNAMLLPGGPSLARCRELGVARVSVGGGLHRVMTSQVGAVLRSLRDGDDTPFREG